jgi:hypothetical protein
VSALTGICAVDSRSLVTRVDARLTVTSSLAVPRLAVSFNSNTENYASAMVVTYSDGPACGEDPSIIFTNVAPNSTRTFTYWVVYDNAVTPDSPEGDSAALGEAFFDLPTILANQAVADVPLPEGDHVINCTFAGSVETHVYYAGSQPDGEDVGGQSYPCTPASTTPTTCAALNGGGQECG